MEALGFIAFLVVGAIFLGVWKGIDFLTNCHPLTDSEVLDLAEKRRTNRALERFGYSNIEQPAGASEKKNMQASGEFVNCNLEFLDAPARIAGLLKSKKHEWIEVDPKIRTGY